MTLSDEIKTYVAKKVSDKLEQHDTKSAKALQKAEKSGADVTALKQELASQREAIVDEIVKAQLIPPWLDKAAKRAWQISLVTHAPKYTHGDSKSSGVVANCQLSSPDVIGTHTLVAPTFDFAGNAAVFDVAALLLLEANGETLWEQVKSGDDKTFREFSKDPNQLAEWMTGLGQAVANKNFQSHTLAKQVFFPVSADQYHLISPLFPTSIQQVLYEQVQYARFSDDAKHARKQKREAKGSAQDVLNYRDLVKLNFGGSKPQNVSLLNSRRSGKAYLMNCSPPVWKEQLRLPMSGEIAFWRLYTRQTRNRVLGLRRYLGRIQDSNNFAVREGRARRVTELVDEFLQLVARLRQLGEAGWSASSDLPLAEQCLLDPARYQRSLDDRSFNEMYERKDWREQVAEAYGRWLNRQLSSLRSNKGQLLRELGTEEAGIWQRELARAVSVLRNDLEHLA